MENLFHLSFLVSEGCEVNYRDENDRYREFRAFGSIEKVNCSQNNNNIINNNNINNNRRFDIEEEEEEESEEDNNSKFDRVRSTDRNNNNNTRYKYDFALEKFLVSLVERPLMETQEEKDRRMKNSG